MLQWLCERPMSVDDFNAAFQADPLIQKTVSEDSIWLYINTLKLLGCDISRPSPSNNFCYELRYQPFGIPLNPDDREILISVKHMAESKMAYPQILHADQFLKKVLRFSTLENNSGVVEDLFNDTHSIDYEAHLPFILGIETAITNRDLLFVSYDSPEKGQEYFYYFPEEILYQRGVLLLRGTRLGYKQDVLLRLDRMLDYEASKQPELIYNELKEMNQATVRVVIKLYGFSPLTLDSLTESLELSEGELVAIEESSDVPAMVLSLETRNLFSLKQKLLGLGILFEILEPSYLRAEMMEMLIAMNRQYDDADDSD